MGKATSFQCIIFLGRPVENRCHTQIGGIFIQKRKLILQSFSN
ncbi:hypothetical protein B4113_0897 [Geobacillus sp. B4113_201601]|nr:hypothetical protein B4113_0897 [Geobacillus sp. B4113_201601]